MRTKIILWHSNKIIWGRKEYKRIFGWCLFGFCFWVMYTYNKNFIIEIVNPIISRIINSYSITRETNNEKSFGKFCWKEKWKIALHSLHVFSVVTYWAVEFMKHNSYFYFTSFSIILALFVWNVRPWTWHYVILGQWLIFLAVRNALII